MRRLQEENQVGGWVAGWLTAVGRGQEGKERFERGRGMHHLTLAPAPPGPVSQALREAHDAAEARAAAAAVAQGGAAAAAPAAGATAAAAVPGPAGDGQGGSAAGAAALAAAARDLVASEAALVRHDQEREALRADMEAKRRRFEQLEAAQQAEREAARGSNAARWWRRRTEVVAFVRQHHRLPRKGARPGTPFAPGEQQLGVWCDKQRAAQCGQGDRAALSPAQIAALAAIPGWYWRQHRGERWEDNYAAVRATTGCRARRAASGCRCGATASGGQP